MHNLHRVQQKGGKLLSRDPGPKHRKALRRVSVIKYVLIVNEGIVSKETVVLRRWGSSIQKFGFINRVDNVNWPPYRDSDSL